MHIAEDACEFRFIHASGPGGQHVNKTATAVELRVRVDKLRLPPETANRLRRQQANRINRNGELIIQATRFRSQLKNRKDALERLRAMISRATSAPKRRVATKPTMASKKKRLAGKKQRGQLKSNRRKPPLDL